MKHTLLATLAIAAASQAFAAEEFTSIFDEKSLCGWTQRNGTATYRVEDGTVVGKTNEGSPNSFLCSDKEYGDFELLFDVKVHESLNSGVQIRSQTKDTFTGRVNGPQVEIEECCEAGYIYGEAAGGWMTPKDKLIPHKHFKPGEWNSYRVIAKGARIQVWLNGTQTSDLLDEEKFKTHPKGFIGLQVHGIKKGTGPYEVAWKNIKIREL
jgi:hypothetical protein